MTDLETARAAAAELAAMTLTNCNMPKETS